MFLRFSMFFATFASIYAFRFIETPFSRKSINTIAINRNSHKYRYFQSKLFSTIIDTSRNRITDNILFEITDNNNNVNLVVSQESKSKILHPVSPISLKLDLPKDASESSMFEALEKGVEVRCNVVLNVCSFCFHFYWITALINREC